MKVAELVDRWLEWRQAVKPMSPGMAANYRRCIELKIKPALSGALQQAVVWGWRSDNPARSATPPAQAKAEVAPPEARQAVKLIETATTEDPELGLFLMLAVMLASRRGELCSLRWTDVDFDHGEVLIDSGVIYVPGRPLIDQDRTKYYTKRRVAVGPATLELLRAHRVEQAKVALAAGVPLAPDAYVFSHQPDGSKPIRPDGVSHRFAKLAQRLGVRCRLHDLRHFMVTHLVAAGATPVWLLGSFAVLSLLYRADQAPAAAEASVEQAPVSAAGAPSTAQTPSTGAEALTKRAHAERAYAQLSADGSPVSAGQLAAAAGLSPSYARALVAVPGSTADPPPGQRPSDGSAGHVGTRPGGQPMTATPSVDPAAGHLRQRLERPERSADGRSHSDSRVGSMVRSATATSSAARVSRSTWSRRRALNASMVLAAW